MRPTWARIGLPLPPHPVEPAAPVWRDGSEDEDNTGYEVSSPLDPLPFPPPILTREYYKITVNTQGFFHIEPIYLEVAPF